MLVSSGFLLALAAWSPWWWGQLVAIPALSGLFWGLARLEPRQAYFAGLLFTAAWILPVTYWYYAFMLPVVAFAASAGWVTLLANLFWLVTLRRWIGAAGMMIAFIIAWSAFTYARLRLPVVEDWWLPHLGYSVWRQSGFMLAGSWGGAAAVEAAALALGALGALAWHQRKHFGLMAAAASVLLIILCGAFVNQAPAKPVQPVIALQRMTEGGVDQPATERDVDQLITDTTQAMQHMDAEVPTVAWPENSIPVTAHDRLAAYAKQQRVRLVYHATEAAEGGGLHKKVIMLDEHGEQLLVNYKQHIAPDEEGVARTSRQHAATAAGVFSAYVCYDLHYPDIVDRLRGSDAAFVPLNDAAYGYLQRQFHAADIALHAAQARTTIVTAGTNGPTLIVNSNGVVVRELPDAGSGVLIFE